MKESYYNFIWKTEQGKTIYFNSSTCALVEVDEDFLDIIKNVEDIDINKLSSQKKKLVDDMKDGGFIVDNCFDEIKAIEFRHYSGKYSSNSLGLTIAPTLNCNFKCIYCYETAKNTLMSEEVKESIVKLVEKRINSIEKLSITWYGGEPLLCKDIIYELSEKFIKLCEENNVRYGAYIITNGYLLDEEVVEKFKKYKIEGAQITLDGPASIHNSRRVLKSGVNDNFEKVLNSIKLVKQAGLSPSIRINTDKSNKEYIPELLDILKSENLQDVNVHFGQVTPYTESCRSISHNCYDTEEFSDLLLSLQSMLNKNGFTALNHPYYPGIKYNYCCCDQINSFVVDPEGYMYKCWNEVGNIEAAVGNITNIDEMNEANSEMIMNNLEYMTWTPFKEEKCKKCKLLPICMGGCPYFRKSKNQVGCERWKYNLKDIIQKTYNNYVADEEKFNKAFNQ